jgi:DNA-binding transcriptional LysR family regulator
MANVTTTARLRALVELADTGSVRAAATRLFVTEASVSAAVTALARDVGVPLVEKNGRGIRLTESGQVYARYARTILGLQDEALAAARGEKSPETGLVRLAAATTASDRLLPDLLAAFRVAHPGIDLRLHVAPRDEVWKMLEHHEVDLAMAGRPPEQLSLTIRATRANTLVVVGSPGHLADFSPGLATWLLREEGSGTRATCLGLLAALDVGPPTLTLGSNGAVVAGAVAGLGVTLVSRDAVREECRGGRLVELPMNGTPLERPWHAVTHAELTPSVGLFLTQLTRDGSWRRSPG